MNRRVIFFYDVKSVAIVDNFSLSVIQLFVVKILMYEMYLMTEVLFRLLFLDIE